MKMITIIGLIFLLHTISSAQSWQWLGPDSSVIHHIYAKNDTIYAGTQGEPVYPVVLGAIIRSTNGGASWDTVNNNIPKRWVRAMAVDPKDTRKIYISNLGKLYKSSNAGESWEEFGNELGEYVSDIQISPHNSNIIFCIASYGGGDVDELFRTTDGGKTWENVSGFAVSSHGVKLAFAFDPVNSNRVYAGGDTQFYQTFYVSTNKGDQWSALTELQTYPKKIIVDWNNNNIIYLFASPFRSEDWGVNWKQVNIGLPSNFWSYWTSLIDPYDSSILYMSNSVGIYITTDRGEFWSLFSGSENFQLNFITGERGGKENLFIDSTTHKMYVGTQQGAYVYNLLTSIDNNEESSTNNFILNQNYPNPFNPNTTIEYSIPSYAISTNKERHNLKSTVFVTLKVYNILGREVATLINKNLTPGNYEVEFNGEGLPSGIYIYKLTAGAVSLTRKMLLVK